MRKTTFILLPAAGFRDKHLSDVLSPFDVSPTPAVAFSGGDAGASERPAPPADQLRLMREIPDDGPKLVEGTAETAAALRQRRDLRVVPVRSYAPMLVRPLRVSAKGLARSGPGTALAEVQVIAGGSGAAVADARVVLALDPDETIGVSGRTGRDGRMRRRIPDTPTAVHRIVVEAPPGYWGRVVDAPNFEHGRVRVALDRADAGARDWLRRLYPADGTDHGRGVRIGIVDTGVAADHPDLPVARHRNMTDDGGAEDAVASAHGTHVAGIVGGRGASARGLAPGAELWSYRVFRLGMGTTTNFDIARAVDQAVQDGCDLINLSLGGGKPDDVLSEAISDAFRRGTACIAAVGNEGRGSVAYPAVFKRAVGVSAMGNAGAFPPDSLEARHSRGRAVNPVTGDSLAAFSNFGSEVDFIAPGVGIVSTVPGGYAAMSGTSMACPVVTALTARHLARDVVVLRMPRDSERAGAILSIARRMARSVGLQPIFEGFGRLV